MGSEARGGVQTGVAMGVVRAHGQGRHLRMHWGMLVIYLLGAALLHFPHYGSNVGDITRDFYLHYNWAKEFAENLAQGNPYPRWMFHGRLGLGEPVFIFYSPLYYHAVGLVALSGLNAWAAMQAASVLLTVTFAWLVYRTLAYRMAPGWAGFIGLVAMGSPFLVMLNYKFDGLAWAAAGYASHGLLFWSVFRPGADPRRINGWAAVAVALAVGSHIVSALINLVCYSLLILVPVGERWSWPGLARRAAAWLATVGLGLGLCGIYLVPALGYLGEIRTGVWDPSVPFTAFAWPLVTRLFYEQRWFSFQWTIAMPALLLAVLAGAYVLRWRRSVDPFVWRPALLLAAAVFLASELSFPVWTLPTPLLKVQLPFRFLSVVYTFAIVLAGLACWDAQRQGRRVWAGLLAGALALSLLAGVATLVKASYLDGSPLPPELRAGSYTFEPFVQRLHAEGECPGGDLGGDQRCLERWASSGGFRGTPEYRLRWAGPGYPEFARSGFEAVCARAGLQCSAAQRTRTGLAWTISASAASDLVLPVFHFPGWAVQVDGTHRAHVIDEATGLMRIRLEAGQAQQVEVVWGMSPLERRGALVSAAALAVLGLWLVLRRRRAAGA